MPTFEKSWVTKSGKRHPAGRPSSIKNGIPGRQSHATPCLSVWMEISESNLSGFFNFSMVLIERILRFLACSFAPQANCERGILGKLMAVRSQFQHYEIGMFKLVAGNPQNRELLLNFGPRRLCEPGKYEHRLA